MNDDATTSRYSALADRYIDLTGAIQKVNPEDLAFIERNLGGCRGTALDVGCGPGHLTAFLTSLGVRARGIDLVPEFIDYGQATWPGIDLSVASMHELDLPDGSLGGILAWYSLIHGDPAHVPEVLATFNRALTPGGTLIVGFFDGDSIEPFDHKVVTAYRWPVGEMSRALTAAGFLVTELERRPGTDVIRPHAAIAARSVAQVDAS